MVPCFPDPVHQRTAALFFKEANTQAKDFELDFQGFQLSAVSPPPGLKARSLDDLSLRIHPLALLDPKEIPFTLQVTDPLDPRLNDSKFIAEWKAFLSKAFDIPSDETTFLFGRTQTTVYIKNLDAVLRFYAVLWQKPAMRERVKKYIIARELAHIQQQKNNPCTFLYWNHFLFERRNLPARATCSEHFPIIAVISIIPSAICVKLKLLAMNNLFIVVAVIAIALIALDLINLYVARRQEKNADIKALEFTKDPEAAKLFFKALATSQKASSYSIVRWVTRPLEYLVGDNSLKDRVRYFKNAGLA